MAKAIGLRQQVKQGLISSTDALAGLKFDADCPPDIIGWLKRRIARGDKPVAPPEPAQAPPPPPPAPVAKEKAPKAPRKEREAPSRSVERRFEVQNARRPRGPLTNSERAEILERAGRQE